MPAETGTFACVGTRVLVAWDGTREANRALHDALPLIGSAEAVTVMHVGTHEADLDHARSRLERVVRHLQRHGVKARPEETLRGSIAISDLLSRIADLGADMLVAGGVPPFAAARDIAWRGEPRLAGSYDRARIDVALISMAELPKVLARRC